MLPSTGKQHDDKPGLKAPAIFDFLDYGKIGAGQFTGSTLCDAFGDTNTPYPVADTTLYGLQIPAGHGSLCLSQAPRF